MSRKKGKENRTIPPRPAAAGWVALAVIIVLILAQWQGAEREARAALAGELAARSLLLADGPFDETATLLAIQAMRLDPSGDAAQVLAVDVPIQPAGRTPSDGYISEYAFSPDGRYAASGSEKHTIRIWEAATGVEVLNLATGEAPAASLDFSADGGRLAYGSTDGHALDVGIAVVLEVPSGREIFRTAQKFGVSSVALSPDGRTLAGGTYDGIVRLWEVDTGRENAALAISGVRTVSALEFSRDGRLLAGGMREDYSVRAWNLASGKEVFHAVHDHYVTCVALSPDGRFVAAGGSNPGQSLRVWEVDTGRAIARIPHVYTVASAAFSPDGRYVLTGSEDLTVRVWDAASGRELARIGDVFVRSVAFSTDGGTARAGDYYETIHAWKWRPEDLIDGACARVSRNLTRDEWQTYIGEALSYRAVCPGLPIEAERVPAAAPMPTSYSTTVSP